MRRLIDRVLFLMMAVAMFAIPAQSSAGDAAPAGEKYVWLNDARLGMPVARILVPSSWRVEGNAAWTYARPVPTVGVWLRLTDPDSGITYEAVQPVASFVWRKHWDNAKDAPKEGDLDRGTVLIASRNRDASDLLDNFVKPLAEAISPGLKTVWLRDDPAVAARAGEKAGKEAESFRTQLAGAKVAAAGSGASMLMEDSVRQVLFTAATMSADVDRGDKGGTHFWNWQTMTAVTAPAGKELPAGVFDAAVAGRLSINPEWLAKAEEARRKALVDYRPDATWPEVNIDQYLEQARRSGQITEQPVDPKDDAALRGKYTAPSPSATKSSPPAMTGYANAVAELLVLGG